jgi:hypothetical protein
MVSGYDKYPPKPGYRPGVSRSARVAFLAAAVVTLALFVAVNWSAAADEQLCPKYGACVPAAAFDCRDVTKSSLVTRVCYAPGKRYMVVGLQGVDYHYCEIGAEVVQAFLDAGSMGRFYREHIRSDATGGRFDCRKHPAPVF